MAGEVDDLLACHRVLTGPAGGAARYGDQFDGVDERRGEARTHLLVRTNGSPDRVPPSWEAHPVTLEEVTLA